MMEIGFVIWENVPDNELCQDKVEYTEVTSPHLGLLVLDEHLSSPLYPDIN